MNKIRLFKASSFYDNYLNYFFTKYKDLENKTYEQLIEKLFYDSFGLSDCIKVSLENSGEFEVFETVINCELLQKKWMRQNKIELNNENNIVLEILKAQIMAFEPDVLFAHDHAFINAAFINEIKRDCKSIKLVIGYDGVGFCDEGKFQGVDLMLTCVGYIRDYYISKSFYSEVFYYGFNENVLSRLSNKGVKKYDISFVGGLNLMSGGHHQRLNTLSSICKLSPHFFISSAALEDHGFYKWPQRNRIMKGKISEALRIYNVGKRNIGARYGLDMFDVLGKSKISLNVHIDNAKENAANIRLFEGTGVGSCLLTDWKSNIAEFFEPDSEVVTFKSTAECVEKAKYLLKDDDLRNKISLAGQKKTLEYFTLQKRCLDIIFIIKKYLN